MPPDRQRRVHDDGISPKEVKHIETNARLRPRVIYEIISVEGREEMARPGTSLWWSGLAAGLSMSFSLLTEAILSLHIPHANWSPLVVDLGYTVGFLIVVLSRQQLFTENTLTVVLPLFARWRWVDFMATGRVWAIVLLANIVGTLFAAGFCTLAPVISPEVRAAMIEVSEHGLAHGWLETLFRAISAGFLIATMVWLIPSAKGAEFHVVFVMTYLIAIGDCAHIVAGSVEAFMLLFAGSWSPVHLLWDFFVPTLIGNIAGGTALFALISYAQVAEEM
jgi:formate/nitrite transporter FocA (FNT family)